MDPQGLQVGSKGSTRTFADCLQSKGIMCLGHLRKTIVTGREMLLWFIKDAFVPWLDS